MKQGLFVPVLLLCQFVLAQTTVSNLHYTYTLKGQNHKGGSEITTSGYNFAVADNILIMDRKVTPDRGFNRQYIDKDNRRAIAIRNERKDFVLEELDSVYYPSKYNFIPSDETQVINGFNCRKYNFGVKRSVSVSTNAPAITVPSRGVDYEYTVWITGDLKMNDAYNPYIFATFYQLTRLVPYEGVIVKLESVITRGKKEWTTETILDTALLNVKPEKPVMPWNEAQPGVALLQLYAGTSGSTTLYREGDKTPAKQFERMKKFLIATTGWQKPKFKQEYVTGIFW
ncbi:MAG: hypothetical protein V4615_00425 [Bacteroidota bacterium]